MKRKAFFLPCWLFHLLLLLVNAVATNGNTTTTTKSTTATSSTPTTTISSGSPTATSSGSSTATSSASTTTTSSGSPTATSSGSTIPGMDTSSSSSSSSSGTNTMTTTSNVTSVSTASPGTTGSVVRHLRPWAVALIALASVVLAVILFVGLTVSLKSSPCIRNLFSTDLYHPYGPNLGSRPQGCHGAQNMPSATGAGCRNQYPPETMELTERHSVPECP
uniref:mucin-21-like n=1 Tax=Ictidomys tridecemlineatus TaxID=43179 RepID=UPI001A9FF838|nr:mucin-21-like [Ictidomys tridecemlineatus]